MLYLKCPGGVGMKFQKWSRSYKELATEILCERSRVVLDPSILSTWLPDWPWTVVQCSGLLQGLREAFAYVSNPHILLIIHRSASPIVSLGSGPIK